MKSFDIAGKAKAKLLNITYERYKELEKDFFGDDEEKRINATIKMQELMKKAGEKIVQKQKGNKNV